MGGRRRTCPPAPPQFFCEHTVPIDPKSLPSNVYFRIFWFAFPTQAILVSKVLYTTALPPNPPPAFYQRIHLSKLSPFECLPSLRISYSSTPSSSLRKIFVYPKSPPSNVYLRIFWFAITTPAILVSKVLYTTTSASFETRKALQSSRFFYSVRTPWGEALRPPPQPPSSFFLGHIHLSSFILSLYVPIYPKFLYVCLRIFWFNFILHKQF